MFPQIIIAAAPLGLVAAASAIVAQSQSRYHSGYYAPSYGFDYRSGERSDPTNTNGF